MKRRSLPPELNLAHIEYLAFGTFRNAADVRPDYDPFVQFDEVDWPALWRAHQSLVRAHFRARRGVGRCWAETAFGDAS